MERPYVQKLRIENYGCIQDATFRFTPLHALIGPNDSGKSTVLRALRTIARTVDGAIPNPGALLLALSASKAGTRFELSGPNATYTVNFETDGRYRPVNNRRGVGGADRAKDALTGPVYSLERPRDMSASEVRNALRGTQLLRLDPDFLRAPHALIADGAPLRFMDERGTGLPALYDALVIRDLPAYVALNAQIARLFPSVKSIQLMNPSETKKAMGVKLVDGTIVSADQMSEGLLYYLAFAVLPHIEPTPLLLIEEPERGLHPARIAEVMSVLRDLSNKTQVIIATHSPLVVNELLQDEITVVTRVRESGTKATLLQDMPNFEERSRVYAFGELWLSYANGEDEALLLQRGPWP